MKRLLALIAVFCFLQIGCATSRFVGPAPMPAWLNALIHETQAAPVANPPVVISRYQFQGDTVYYLPARCCDIPSTVYRADGSILCHPDGGLDGKGDGKCPTFFADRKSEEIIWRDPRTAG
jgi:hypothetical protein